MHEEPIYVNRIGFVSLERFSFPDSDYNFITGENLYSDTLK